MPHLLIAGATGSGKSVCINTLIMSLLYTKTPAELRFIFIDPKMLELTPFNGIPHLRMPVVTDPKKAAQALRFCVKEMERRYQMLAKHGARNIEAYNRLNLAPSLTEEPKLPYLVVVVDELADLMALLPTEIEEPIQRLAPMGRPVVADDSALEQVRISDSDADDDLYEEAMRLVVLHQQASTSMLQRRLKVGYSRAARLLDLLEERGVVGPSEGAKGREVHVTEQELADRAHEAPPGVGTGTRSR